MANDMFDFKAPKGSSVAFGTELFKNVRRRSDKLTQDMNDFGKKIMFADVFSRGLEWGLNNKVEEFNRSQAPAFNAYNKLLERNNSYILEEQDRIKQGISEEQYLENKYRQQLVQGIKEQYGENVNMVPLYSLVNKYARQKALDTVSQYKSTIQASKTLPNYKDDEFEKAYLAYSDQPQNPGELILNNIVDFFKKETPESLIEKNAKATDALYGTELGRSFENFEKQADALELISEGSGYDLFSLISEAKKGKLFTGNIIDTQIVTEKDYSADRQTFTETTKIVGISRDLDTGGLEIRPENKIKVKTDRILNDGEFLSASDIKNALEDIDKKNPKYSVALKTLMGNDRPTYETLNKFRVYVDENNLWAIDWNDEDKVANSFEKYYSAVIANETFIDSRGKEIPIGTWEQDKRIWTLNPDALEEAKRRGLDQVTQLERFRKKGFDLSATQEYNPDTEEMKEAGKNPLSSIITKPENISKIKQFIDGIGDESSTIEELFGEALNNPENKDKNLIVLSDNVDENMLKVLLEEMGIDERISATMLQGTTLYYNKKDQKFYLD